ncbi:MAG: hypothetical protein COT18_12285 [Elusimicrobia bacterium CG08_land_8_20_14_0_20_59_10]|nr:MAG: hypothetical protein COT18_12285 [Elusimicrobia bacterium CG08_land_8_20_14_0_20_59_10]
MIGQLIAEIVYPSALYLKRHKVLRILLLIITLAIMAFGVYRIYQLRGLPCLPGSCNKPAFIPDR